MTIDANWYVDPNQPGQGRYWDGTQWTEHVTEIGHGAVFATFPGSPAPQPGAQVPHEGAPSTRQTVTIAGKQIPLLVLGGVVAVLIVAVVLIVVVSGGSSGSYSSARDIASAISSSGAGCQSPSFHTEAGIAEVGVCNVDGNDVEIAYFLSDAGESLDTALQEARVDSCGVGGQEYYVAGDRWEVSAESQIVMKKVQDAVGGTLKSLC